MKKLTIGIISLVVLIALASAAFVYVRNETTLLQPSIAGNVTDVVYDEADTIQSITVRTADATTYVIGISSAPTDDDTIYCVTVPDLKKGDTIEFKLPATTFNAEDFLTCYSSDSKSYYITAK